MGREGKGGEGGREGGRGGRVLTVPAESNGRHGDPVIVVCVYVCMCFNVRVTHSLPSAAAQTILLLLIIMRRDVGLSMPPRLPVSLHHPRINVPMPLHRTHLSSRPLW